MSFTQVMARLSNITLSNTKVIMENRDTTGLKGTKDIMVGTMEDTTEGTMGDRWEAIIDK